MGQQCGGMGWRAWGGEDLIGIRVAALVTGGGEKGGIDAHRLLLQGLHLLVSVA